MNDSTGTGIQYMYMVYDGDMHVEHDRHFTVDPSWTCWRNAVYIENLE
jgi:hypothetical protein